MPGYTNLEHYLNSLVDDITDAQNDDGVVMQGTETTDDPEDGDEETSFIISQKSFTGENHPTEKSSVWDFKDGFRILVDDNLVCSTGYFPGINGGKKYSSDMTFTVEAPEHLLMTGFKVVGGTNHASTKAYVKQIDETAYTEEDYVFPLKDGSVAKSYEFTFDGPQRSFSIVFGGEQGIFTIEVYYLSGTDIQGVKTLVQMTEDTAVYDLSGRKVAESLNGGCQLQKGIYIIKGKKIIIK